MVERPADGSSADLRYATSFGLVAVTPFWVVLKGVRYFFHFRSSFRTLALFTVDFIRSGKDPLEDLIYTSCTDPIQQPAAARTPRLYTSPRLLNYKEITLLFVYGSSDINILHLHFFRSGKDAIEYLIYTSCTDPIQQPAAARTPRLYTNPRLCQSLLLRLFHSRITVLCSTADSADVKVADPPVVSTADPDFLFLQLLLLLSSTTDQTSHFRMRPVLFPPKWSNEQDSLLRSEHLCFWPNSFV
ncbi:lipid transfer-like protein VAS [Dorcoceras hygrometricum]|uniref:Lipid transfer-like protein VAS n=1 Tax=Dorcoceras hygrometricum TaxID=472368 RepID=A0A2Z7A2M3_9LAMI|nr:lipid transfer-like protein VAS [Dorcoceras hygrometricum]